MPNVNITLTEEQRLFVIENNKKMKFKEMAVVLGVSYSKLIANVFLMGINKNPPKDDNFETKDGFFDVDKFGKFYNY